MAVKDNLREFCRTTTIGGIPRIAKSGRIGFRIYWVICTLIVYALVAYVIANYVMHYLQYPKVISMGEEHRALVPMPDVTICDKHPFPASDMAALKGSGSVTYSEFLAKVQQEVKCVGDLCTTDVDRRIIEKLRSDLMSRKGYFQFLNQNERTALGHNNLIMECFALTISGERLDCAGIIKCEQHILPDFFSCQECSVKHESMEITGLELVLFLDRNKPGEDEIDIPYTPGMDSSEGIRIFLNADKTEYSRMNEYIDIDAGVNADIKLTRKENKRLPAPYGMCNDEQPRCANEFVDKVEMDCHCTYLLDSLRETNTTSSKSFCGDLNEGIAALKTRHTCLQDIHKQSNCRENTLCDQTLHDFSVMNSKWPQVNQMISFMQSIDGNALYPYKDPLKGLTKTQSKEYVRANFAKVLLEMEGKVTTIEEKPAIAVNDLLMKLGWTVCFLCGMTLFFFVEIIECLVKICLCVKPQDGDSEYDNADSKDPSKYKL